MLNLVALYSRDVLPAHLKRKLDGLHVAVNSLADKGSINSWEVVAKEFLRDLFPRRLEVGIFPEPLMDSLP